MSSADLASWLLEQIALQEARAQGDIEHFGESSEPRDQWIEKMAHQFLAECDAKRKIVMRCALLLEAFDDPEHGAWHDVNRRERSHARMTLEALALPFADRPGYQEEWRP